MARFLPALFAAGVRAVIGKGELHGDDMTAFVTHGACISPPSVGWARCSAKQNFVGQLSSAYDDLGPRGTVRARRSPLSCRRHHRPDGRKFPRDGRRNALVEEAR
jgi:hypothetical protein